MGQTLTHLAQRMQGSTGLREASGCGINRTPEVPLVTGISVEVKALPIIGPPPIILPVSSGSPPAASINTEMGVPMRVRKLAGRASDRPVTVTMRSIRGLFF